MKIFFVDDGKAYKPELHAYRAYFVANGFTVETVNRPSHVDSDAVTWHFTGFDPSWQRLHSKAVVHDYASLSVPPFPRVKNLAKRILNRRPALRIFLNRKVQKSFGFSDSVPSVCRDMGVDESFFLSTSKQLTKTHEFVYIGSVSRLRRIDEAFGWILRNQLGRILVIGEPDGFIREKFAGCRYIDFAGQVPYREIPKLAVQAKYGLNWVPDVYPFNLQTSTKLIEYCAMGIPIVSNRYSWVEEFARARNGSFFLFNPEMTVDRQVIDNFRFSTPNVDDLEWESLLSRVGGVGLAQTLQNAINI